MFPFTTGESIFLFCVLEFSDVIEAILLLSLNLQFFISMVLHLSINLPEI